MQTKEISEYETTKENESCELQNVAERYKIVMMMN